MDISYTGNKISELRKKNGLTQKELAELLNVTDKAVSKWERGLNFPELFTLEKIAELFQISVIELLGIEDHSNEQVFSDISNLAQNEKKKIIKEIYDRGWVTVILGILIWISLIYVSKILADNHLYGLPQMASGGMSGAIATIIANGFVSIWKGRKLYKN